MKSLNGNIKTDDNQFRQLEAENRSLQEENQQLRVEKAAEQEKLKQQQNLEQRYEESRSRFHAIFYQSKLGKKIIGPDFTDGKIE